jgi:hypothetical protein
MPPKVRILCKSINFMVAKSVALNMDSAPAVAEWRTQISALLDAAEGENFM